MSNEIDIKNDVYKFLIYCVLLKVKSLNISKRVYGLLMSEPKEILEFINIKLLVNNLYSLCINQNKEKELEKYAIGLLKKTCNNSDYDTFPFDLAMTFVYELSDFNNFSQLQDTGIERIVLGVDGKNSEIYNKITNKLDNYIKTSITQVSSFSNKMSSIDEKINKIDKTLKNFEKLKAELYTNFISILGIFSTLIFGMFGGFDGLKEILSNLHNTSISTTLICFSSLMIGLLCLVFLLIQSIAKITQRDTLSCRHHGNNEKCECSVVKKYPIFIYSMLIFSTILIIGCIIRFFDYRNLYNASLLYWSIAVIVTLIIFLVLYKIGVISIIWNVIKDIRKTIQSNLKKFTN